MKRIEPKEVAKRFVETGKRPGVGLTLVPGVLPMD